MQYRIVKPVVLTVTVQVKQSGSEPDAEYVRDLLVTQNIVRQHSHGGNKNRARQKNQSVNPKVRKQIDCLVS